MPLAERSRLRRQRMAFRVSLLLISVEGLSPHLLQAAPALACSAPEPAAKRRANRHSRSACSARRRAWISPAAIRASTSGLRTPQALVETLGVCQKKRFHGFFHAHAVRIPIWRGSDEVQRPRMCGPTNRNDPAEAGPFLGTGRRDMCFWRGVGGTQAPRGMLNRVEAVSAANAAPMPTRKIVALQAPVRRPTASPPATAKRASA